MALIKASMLSEFELRAIFEKIPKIKLGEIAMVCPRFREILSDPRIWKNVRIVHPRRKALAFEDLFTGPCPIEEIDLEGCEVNPPVTRYTGPKVKVTRLLLGRIVARITTTTAILRKYQTEELVLDSVDITPYIAFAIISEQRKHLRKLSLRNEVFFHTQSFIKILERCSSLKEVDLSWKNLSKDVLDNVCSNLPKTLDRLQLNFRNRNLSNKHIQLLWKKCPNLKELGLPAYLLKCATLSRFGQLDTLYVSGWNLRYQSIQRNLTRLARLRRVFILLTVFEQMVYSDFFIPRLRRIMEPSNIVILEKRVTLN